MRGDGTTLLISAFPYNLIPLTHRLVYHAVRADTTAPIKWFLTIPKMVKPPGFLGFFA